MYYVKCIRENIEFGYFYLLRSLKINMKIEDKNRKMFHLEVVEKRFKQDSWMFKPVYVVTLFKISIQLFKPCYVPKYNMYYNTICLSTAQNMIIRIF